MSLPSQVSEEKTGAPQMHVHFDTITCYISNKSLIAEWLVLLVREREVHGSNPGVVFAPTKKNLSKLQPLN